MSISANDFLNFILDLFENSKSNEALLRYLKSNCLLSDNYEERYIINNVEKKFRLNGGIEIHPNYWVFYLESANDGCPYRLEIVKVNDWKLKSLVFLCSGCFGEDKNCNVCGGEGWGVL